MQSQKRPAMGFQDLSITGCLRSDEPSESEVPTGNIEVLRWIVGELQEHACRRTSLVELTGGMQKARAPAKRHGALGPLGKELTKLGVPRQRQPIEVGLNGHVSTLRIQFR